MATMLPQKVIVSVLSRGQGLAGPAGPIGPAGPASGAGAEYIAGAVLSGHMGVTIDASGKAVYASAATLAHIQRFAGITLNAAALDALVTVQSSGLIEHAGWTWTADQPVYLGLNGTLVQTPALGSLYLLVVGKATSPTRLLVNVQPPIVTP